MSKLNVYFNSQVVDSNVTKGSLSYNNQNLDLDGSCLGERTLSPSETKSIYTGTAKYFAISANQDLEITLNGTIVHTIKKISQGTQIANSFFASTGEFTSISIENLSTTEDCLASFQIIE